MLMAAISTQFRVKVLAVFSWCNKLWGGNKWFCLKLISEIKNGSKLTVINDYNV